MTRLPVLALTLTVALFGCNRAPKTLEASGGDPSAPQVQPAPAPASAVPPSIAFTLSTRKLVSSGEIPLLEQINRENTTVIKAALPSIVRITATRPADPRVRMFDNGILHMPFGPSHRSTVLPEATSYGSGVIISKDGYILTNAHVVSGSKVLEVQLDDNRTFHARSVATDDLVDVAILKIDATDLSVLPWGDSDKVQVGEQVFAIGNPFDLDDSVSKGIVSAKGRNLPRSRSYQDYIQTDAAINPGNSGGALIDIHGELIGLNAAIASTTGYNMGIGFAIPSNLVRYAVEDLLVKGHPVRGFLGVLLPVSVDDGVVKQLNLKSSRGAFLAGVQPGSPADAAKLRAFDFITAVDGHRVDSEPDLRLIVAQIPIGKDVQVDFVRDGKPLTTHVKVTEIPQSEMAVSSSFVPESDEEIPANLKEQGSRTNVLAGMQVADLNDKMRQKFGVTDRIASGVVVSNVAEGSLPDLKGIERGDVIESASARSGSTQALESAKDFTDLSGKLPPDQGVVLLVHTRQNEINLVYLAPEEN